MSLGVWFYCYWFVAIGTRKIYEYKGGDSVKVSSGYVSANLYESDFPYRLSFMYNPRSEVAQPQRVKIENVILTGRETQNSYELGSLSGDIEHRIAIISFEVRKEKGMKYEPHDVEATVTLIFEDGSEKSQQSIHHIETDFRERDKIPRWHYFWM